MLYQAISIPTPNSAFQAQTTFVYYQDGKQQLGTYYEDQNRESIPYDEMPDTMKDAVVAAENQTFWTDKGIDPKGILRALFSNASGNARQGASTITQQYVKILYLTSEQSYKRKIKEAVVSLKIQQELDKKEVLEGYLNTIYFGRGAYGIQAASKAFFDHDAKDLSLRESAVLATVLNNPARFDPANGKEAGRTSRTATRTSSTAWPRWAPSRTEERDKALKRLPEVPQGRGAEPVRRPEGPHAGAGQVRAAGQGHRLRGGDRRWRPADHHDLRPRRDGRRRGGVLEEKPDGFGDKQLHIGAATVEVGTGAVRGFYGGQDYLQSQINWAATGGMAGSTIKPLTVAAAIKQGFSLKDTFQGNSPYRVPRRHRGAQRGHGQRRLGNDYGDP